MKLTAKDLLRLKIIDEIIPEPLGGAHRDQESIANEIKIQLPPKNLKMRFMITGKLNFFKLKDKV